MHFFHQTLLYMTFEVAEPAWRRFQTALAAAATVEQARAVLILVRLHSYDAPVSRLLHAHLSMQVIITARSLWLLPDCCRRKTHPVQFIAAGNDSLIAVGALAVQCLRRVSRQASTLARSLTRL